MAKRANASLASNKSVNTKWLQNALRSIGVSTKNVLKNDFAPNIYEAVESGANTSRSIVNSLRRSSSSGANVTNQLRNNKYVKFAQTAYKNALYDIKTGNFNNEDRFADSLFGGDSNNGFSDDIDSLFDDSGLTFGDDGADVNVNVINAGSGNSDAMFAITTQLQKQTEAQLKTSQANMDAMIAINSASMMQVQQIGSQVVSGLASINQNLASLIEYNNSNMTKFIESSIAFYERMGSKMDSDSSFGNDQQSKITANQLMNSNTGGINFAQYKQYITQQMKGAFGNSSAGMVTSLIDDDMIKMAVSNPLGFATEGLIKFMVPKMLANTIKGVEETFSSFMPSLLHKLSNWGDEYATDALGKAKQFIGKTFGIRMERTSKIDKGASIEKGPVPFDGVTKHAITEIITKELREQTSYLKKIAEHYGIDTKDAKLNSDVFDYKTGRYIKEKDVTNNILNEIKDATLASMKSGSFGQEMKKAVGGARNDKERDAISAMVDELLLRFEKNGKYVSMTDKDFQDKNSDYSKIIGSVSGDKALKNYLDKYIQDMVKRNPNAAMDLSRSVISANASRNSAIKNIQENPSEYNLYAATGLDSGDIDDLIFQMIQNQNTDSGKTGRGNQNRRRSHGRKISDKQIESMISNAHQYDDLDNLTSGTGQINLEGNRTFNGIISSAGSGMQNIMRGVLNGNADEAFNALGSMVIDQTKIAFNAFKDNFLTPLKSSFFGTKDSDGFSRDGIFSGVSNSFKDMVGVMKWHITGKSFKDSKGKMYENKQDGDSVIGNLKGIATQVKNGVLEKLFGKEELDADGNPTGRSKKGILGGFKESIKNGLIGWQEALFGKKLNDDEKKNLKESMVKNLNDRLPSSMTGSVLGAGVGMMASGSLLGFLVGGPIGGAALGAAVGFASKSEKFQNYLFGEKDENGERTGGFVSKGVQDFFKKNKNFIIGGTALGAVKGAITGGGLLGTIAGGPIAGAMMGMASSIVLKSETFNEFLFGNKKTGQKGIIESFKSVFNRNKKENSQASDGGKALGMSIVGAGAGALTAAVVGKMGILGAALTPMGPIGGALIGLGLSIKAQKNTFKEWLFGKKDDQGNKTQEGILGQFKNMLEVSVMRPLKNSMANFIDDAKYELRYHILSPIRLAVEPIGNAIGDFASSIKEKVTGIFNTVGDGIRDNLISPVVKRVDSFIITPVRKAVGGVTRAIWGSTKRIVTMPFRLLDAAVSFTQSKIAAGLTALKQVTIDPMKELFKKTIINPTKKVFGMLFKGLGFAANLLIKKPLDVIGGFSGYIGDRLTGVNTEDRVYEDAGGIDDSNRGQRQKLKEQAKIDRYNIRKNKRERKIRNQNEQAIARATNYQFIEDTEENRKRAIAAGAKINDRIKAVDEKKKGESTNGMNEADILGSKLSDLTEEGKQTNILLRILNVLKGKPSPADSDAEKPDKSENKDSSEKKNDDESNNEETSSTDTPQLKGADKIAFDIAQSGGIFNYIKNKGKQTKQDIKDGYEGSYMQSKVNSIKSIIGRFRGNHYADGTENAKPGPAIINEGEPEIVDMSGGEKVYSNKKPIAVTIVGMAKGIGSAFRNIFGRGGSSKSEPDGTNTDSGDVVSDAVQAATMEGGSTEAGMSIINNSHPNKGKDEENQESFEDDSNNALMQIEAKNRLNDAIDKGYTAEERQKKLEEEEQKAKMDKLVANTGEQVKEQKGFSNLWSSIFSKKGLITGLILAALPLILKILKKLNITDLLSNLGGAAGSALSGAIDSAQFVNENGGLGDSKSASDKIDENIDRFTSILGGSNGDGGFILNEDGKWDHMSEANVKGLAKVGHVGAKWATQLTGNFIKGKAAASALKGTADDATTAILGSKAYSLGKEAISNFGKNNLKAGLKGLKGSTDDVVRAASSTAAETASKTASELLKNVIKKITSFFDNVCSGVAKKLGKKVAPNVVSGLLDDVVKVVTKHFPNISEKIVAVLDMTAGLAATGVGLLAKEGTFIVLGAINGATGPARLFKVDNEYVDKTMISISSALGAFSGSTIGSIMDIINELVVSVTGVDVYTELATFIYNFIAGEEKSKILRSGREKFEQSYLDYKSDELEDQYNTLVNAGLLDGNSVSFEDYIAGVNDGTYKADYDSFADYNDNQHQTLGSRVGKGLTSIGKGIKSGISKAGGALFGSTKTYKEDKVGNKYYNNKDGTWQVYSKDGKDFGYISEDAVPEDAKSKKEKQRGLLSPVGDAFGAAWNVVSKAGLSAAKTLEKGAKTVWDGTKKTLASIAKGTKNFFADHKESVFYAHDGSYYTADGKHYSADGSTELKPLTPEEVASLVASSELEEGEITVKSGLKKISATIFENVKSAWGTFKDGAIEVGQNILEGAKNVWDKTKSFASKAKTGIANFFTKDYETAYYANDGSYYLENGTHYSATGEQLNDSLTLVELSGLISQGVLKEGDIVTRDSGINQLRDKAITAVKDGWSQFKSFAVSTAENVRDGAISLYKRTSSFLADKGTKFRNFMLGRTDTAWYDSEGGFYISNGSTYDYYSTTGEKLQTGITAEEFEGIVKDGSLTEGTASVPSGLKTTIASIADTTVSGLKSAWSNIKTIAGNVKDTATDLYDRASSYVVDKGTKFKNFMLGRTDTAWYDSEGGFYISNGSTFDYYSTSGEKIQSDISAEEFEGYLKMGHLTEGTATVPSGLSTKIDEVSTNIKNNLTKAWDNITTFAGNVKDTAEATFDRVTNFLGNKLTSAKEFLLGSTKKAWYDPEGGYYIANGSSFDYYNIHGDLISEGVDAEEVTSLINDGTLTEGEIHKDSVVKTKLLEIKTSVKETFTSIIEKGGEVFGHIRDTGIKIYETIKEEGLFGSVMKLFSKTSSKVWFDPNGNYYKLNGGKYDYYNANNDLITKGISAEEVQRKLTAGILTEGTIQKDSAAKDAIKKIQSSVKDAWDSAKQTVSSGWSNFVKWLTGGGGTMGGFGESDYGELSMTSGVNDAYRLKGIGKDSETLRPTTNASGSGRGRRRGGFGRRRLRGGRGFIDKMSSFFSEFGSRALTGMLTGEYDNDWSSVWSDDSSSSSSGSNTNSSGTASGSGNFPTYNLSENELKGLANIIQHEQPGIEGHYAEASQMANLTDVSGNERATKENLIKKATGGWYANGLSRYNAGKSGSVSIEATALQAARDVFNNGKRTLPRYVDEHDYVGDITSISTGSKSNRGDYRQHQTVIRNAMGSTYTFYEFPNANSDPFGYTSSANRDKWGDAHYNVPGGSGKGRRRRFGGRGSIPYYAQTDPLWGSDAYGTDGATMADTGCGPTAMAMVASGFTGKEISPEEMAALAQVSGMRDESGTNAGFIDIAANAYGMDPSQTFSPTANSIYESAMNGPTVLLGQNSSGINNPFTDAGHYVVIDGVDGNGMVNVKDPRGSGYNRKYSVNDLANTTGTMWGFGGFGRKIKNAKNKILGKLRGGFGVDRTKWLNIVRAVKKAIAAQKPNYSQSNFINITVGGVTKNVRTDCSGYVGACLRYYGVWPDGTNIWTGVMGRNSSTMVNTGFTPISWPGWDGLTEGDILVNTQTHTEIFAYNGSDGHYVYNCGSDASTNSPVPTRSGKSSYELVWKPGNPGSGAVTADPSDNYSYSGSDNSSSSSGNSVSESSSALEKIGGFMSEFGDRAIMGMITGSYDNDWSSFWSGTNSSSGSSTLNNVSGANTESINLSGNSNAEKIWNYYKGKNLKPNTIAGMMGNMHAESGLNPKNLQNSFESKLGMTDDSYTQAVDNGKYGNFVKDSAGYGLVQWTYWSLKQELLNYAKQSGKSIGDLGMQLEFLQKQLSEGYPSTWNKMVNAKSPEDASTIMLTEFERPAVLNTSTRAGYARQFYNQFNGGSGNGRTSIRPRIVKHNHITPHGGRGNTIENILSSYGTGNSSAYTSAATAQKYISNIDSSNMATALNMIIGLLEAITGNTAGASDKLDLLKNLTNGSNSSVFIGGNTTNVVNSGGGTTSSQSSIISGGNGTKVSRNQKLAEKIARGF